MRSRFDMAWEFYLQGFRLHNRMTKEGNLEAQRMFDAAIRRNPEFARAYGHLSFTILTAWLNDWITPGNARRLLARAVGRGKRRRAARNPLAAIPAIVAYYAEQAASLDGGDYDNQWSLATARLYSRRYQDALDTYGLALKLTKSQGAPVVNQASLVVDRADAYFFTAPLSKAGNTQVLRAIADTRRAITLAASDPKRHHWNWTLGWAYYEAGEYGKSLDVLQRFRNPHDLIRKNIIASYAALGMVERANVVADEFRASNPNYRVSIEDRWPYEDKKRLERWKDHLRRGGIERK